MPSRLVSPHGGPDPEQRGVGGGAANRVAGVGAESDRAEAGGHRRRRSARGTSGHPVRIVGVPGVTRHHRAEGLVGTERIFGHVRLGQHDRAGLADPAHLEGVVARHRVLKRTRSGGRGQIGGVVVVLDDRRDALERPSGIEAGGPDSRVRFPGADRRLRVHGDDRMEGRSAPVVRLDAGQVGRDQFGTGEGPAPQSLVDGRDVEFDHLEAAFLRRLRKTAGGERPGRRQGPSRRRAARASGTTASRLRFYGFSLVLSDAVAPPLHPRCRPGSRSRRNRGRSYNRRRDPARHRAPVPPVPAMAIWQHGGFVSRSGSRLARHSLTSGGKQPDSGASPRPVLRGIQSFAE